ncbi:MAG: PEP-utilizing enzyme, partial [Nannocystaceae bacterium]
PRESALAPRNPTESTLAEIWEDLLEVPSVGVRDNFFALGGHSLMVVSLIERIADALGQRLPVASIFERPTIEALAEQLDGGPTTGESPLVIPMHRGGEGLPIFCFAGLGVHHVYLRELVAALGRGQPVYGVQPLGPDAELLAAESMEELAAEIADAIQTVRPAGPYAFVGHSAGARVALAVAELLEQRGQQVDLAALDVAAPTPDETSAVDWEFAGTLVGYLRLINRALEGGLEQSIAEIAKLDEAEAWEAAIALLHRVGFLPRDNGPAILRRMIAINSRFVSMVSAYRPKTRLSARFLVVTTGKQFADTRKVTTAGWERLTSGDVRAAVVSGGHVSMLRAPHVDALGEYLRGFVAEQTLATGPAGAFPVSWDNASDARATWVFDEVHNREPMTPLDFDLLLGTRVHGQNFANERYEMQIRSTPGHFNSYVYLRVAFANAAPEALEANLATAEQRVREVVAELGERWTSSWLPETQSHLEALRVSLSGMQLPDLLTHLRETRRRIKRLWEIHFVLLTPMTVAMSDFEDAFRDLFPESDNLDAYELLAGLPNKTIETNLGLWQLSKRAAEVPELRALLANTQPADLAKVLQREPCAQGLWADLVAFLEVYGERNANLYLDAPTWIEDPTPALQALRDAVLDPKRDLAAEHAALGGRREAKLAEVRQTLASYPRAVVDEFETLLATAQVGSVLREDHNFWLDNKIAAATRRACIALGHGLVCEKVLDRAEDVLFLRLDELDDAETIRANAAVLRARVAARQQRMARDATLTPAPFLGEMLQLPEIDNAVLRANVRLTGAAHGPPPPAGELRGLPGSRGVTRGRVRIAATLAEAEALQPGEVLVAPTTLPTWTTYFGRCAAVVTNVGGALSHAAVVAREYSLPAVVGARGATTTLKNGMLIEVDGGSGVIRILEET